MGTLRSLSRDRSHGAIHVRATRRTDSRTHISTNLSSNIASKTTRTAKKAKRTKTNPGRKSRTMTMTTIVISEQNNILYNKQYEKSAVKLLPASGVKYCL